MQSVVWVQINFDAAHNPVGWVCPYTSGMHGHRYSIRAYRSSHYVEASAHSTPDLRESLLAIRTELQGTVIDNMMVGADTSLMGIATWMLERLPLATAIRVSTEDDEAVEVHR